ncbi:hypothetical protein BYT27DRAFT_7182147 [Phlegmacium glaucopus]|nr:hypothetical protein BYT27DRAFT_7182147 [Phlegmacium glaucopus]
MYQAVIDSIVACEINGGDNVNEDTPIEPCPTRRDVLKAVSTIGRIIPSHRADKPIISDTATGAWSNRQYSNPVSGPDFFGLGQNTIKHLLQELLNSDRLRDYVCKTLLREVL